MKGYLRKAGLVAICVATTVLGGCSVASKTKALESSAQLGRQVDTVVGYHEKEKLCTSLREQLYKIVNDEKCKDVDGLVKKLEDNSKAYKTTADNIDQKDDTRTDIRYLLYEWAEKERLKINAIQLAKYTIEHKSASPKDYKQTVGEKFRQFGEQQGFYQLGGMIPYFARDVGKLKLLSIRHAEQAKGMDEHWVTSLLANSIIETQVQSYKLLRIVEDLAKK